MSALKRMGLAFVCMVLAIGVIGVCEIVPTVVQYGPRFVRPALDLVSVYFLFAVPGWFLALPFVLAFKDADGRRGPLILVIGTAIGPGFLLVWEWVEAGGFHPTQGDVLPFVLSGLIACITSGLYVLLLRRFTRRAVHASRA